MDSKTATERLRELLDERKADYRVHQGIINGSMSYYDRYTVLTDGSPCAFIDTGNGDEVVLTLRCAPEQAIAATLESEREQALEKKVRLQGDYIDKLTKEKNALFAQNCEAATRHAGQMDMMQRKLDAATLGRGTCHDQAAPNAKRFCCSVCCTTDAQKNPLFCHGCGRKVDT